MIASDAGKPTMVRSFNKQRLLALIFSSGPLSRADLARRSGLTRASVSQVVADLLAAGWIEEVGRDADRSQPGRKPVLLQPNARAGCVAGVDLGGRAAQVAVADLQGQILARRSWNLGASPHREAITADLFREVKAAVQAAGFDRSRLLAIGVGTPGIVEWPTGTVTGASPNIPGWAGVPLGTLLRQEFGVPVVVENDVNAALVGECWRGAGRSYQTAVLLSLGTGVGAALWLGGQLYRGATGGAGEVGYSLLGLEALEKDWGNRGCLESLVAGCSPGDERRLLYMATTTCNLVALLDPEIVIIASEEPLAPAALAFVKKSVEKHTPFQPMVVSAGLGSQATLYGALALSLKAACPWAQGDYKEGAL